MNDLAVELQKIYDSDSENQYRDRMALGRRHRGAPTDKMSGFLAEEILTSTSEILPWLREAIAQFYPNSTYASSLDAEVRARGVSRMLGAPGSRLSNGHR